MAGPEAALLGLVPSARARRTACFAFLAAPPVLVAAAASLAASSGPDAAASFSPSFVLRPLLEYYSSCWLPRCLFAAIVASLPPVSGLLQHLLGFAAEDDLSAARDGEDSEEPTLEGAAVEANAPVVYGLRHTALNLRVDGYWLNMGYWKLPALPSPITSHFPRRNPKKKKPKGRHELRRSLRRADRESRRSRRAARRRQGAR
ncbi:MAG: hypothetical protein BJ554DRAFT_4000 [Olpidium bornovanus]|uniref:Uncharacterized protein n=1 Tax=Olpidium bornovanus TaxID=278681 RepID=A0A8H7ZNA5_9FUNG|nr:MAG: hypothetical protein BJ554DRAFT_4000 [Olpidium bornovanus]